MRPVTITNYETGEVSRTKVARSTQCGKQGYSSKKLAIATAKHQSKLSGDQIEAYHCFSCHAFHCGHVPGSPRSAP